MTPRTEIAIANKRGAREANSSTSAPVAKNVWHPQRARARPQWPTLVPRNNKGGPTWLVYVFLHKSYTYRALYSSVVLLRFRYIRALVGEIYEILLAVGRRGRSPMSAERRKRSCQRCTLVPRYRCDGLRLQADVRLRIPSDTKAARMRASR